MIINIDICHSGFLFSSNKDTMFRSIFLCVSFDVGSGGWGCFSFNHIKYFKL